MDRNFVNIKETLQEHQLNNTDELWDLLNSLPIELTFKYLLSHHDDGVIWGINTGGWKLSEEKVNSPKFSSVTLQQCRLFGPSAEFFLWKSGDGYKSRLLVEGSGDRFEFLEKRHMLWGTEAEPYDTVFSLLREGQQGMLHLLPIKDVKLGAALSYRSYIDYDQDNRAYFRWHRLTGIETDVQAINYRKEEKNG